MIVSIIGNKAKSQPVEENEKASATQTHKRQSEFKPRGQSPELGTTDILTSFNYTESVETTPPLSFSVCKVVPTTGLATLEKKTEIASEFVTQMGNAKQTCDISLVWLLTWWESSWEGQNEKDWAAKYKVMIEIGRERVQSLGYESKMIIFMERELVHGSNGNEAERNKRTRWAPWGMATVDIVFLFIITSFFIHRNCVLILRNVVSSVFGLTAV